MKYLYNFTTFSLTLLHDFELSKIWFRSIIAGAVLYALPVTVHLLILPHRIE